MALQEILIVKQTKRSEKEVNIRPMIYQMEVRSDGIYMQLAAGSAENLKPELVMTAFLRSAGIDEKTVQFSFHRLEMYADTGSEVNRELVTLESLGQEIAL